MDHVNVSAKFEVRSFTVPEITVIAVLGWDCEPPNLGEGEAVGPRGSSIFRRFRDTVAFVLQHATFPHPISSLPKISPCSPGSRWMAFGV